MSETANKSVADRTSREALSALSPDLPLLASRAAIELDNLLQGHGSNLRNVRLLSERLNNSTERITGNARQFVSDPATLDVLALALDASSVPVRSVQEVAEEAWRVAEELHHAASESHSETQRLEKLRTFCNELSRNASIYRHLIEEAQPSYSRWS